jgi:hypothetical protein
MAVMVIGIPNYEHQKGKHKALLFEKRLGITIANKEILNQALQEAAIEGEAELFNLYRCW